MELAVYNTSGKATSKKVKLNESIFGIEPNDHAIYLDVKQFLANQRQGTHKAKERAEITGSTRKIKKQKGTGTARAGSVKSGTRVGGGRIFGPRPRNYSFKLNKKLKQLARKSALAHKAKDENLMILDAIKMDAPRTKEFVQVISNLKFDAEKTLFITANSDKNVALSARNLGKTKVAHVDALNTYDVLNASKLIIEEGALARIDELLK
jgi:large subunit ribosomal protein L4